MSYDQFATDVNVGERILVDDGKIVLEVVATNKKDEVKLKFLALRCRPTKVWICPTPRFLFLFDRKKDLEDLDYILTQPVNWIALSFVRKASDILDLKQRIAAKGHHAKWLPKLKTRPSKTSKK